MNPKTVRSLQYSQVATYAFAALCFYLAMLEFSGGFQFGFLHLSPRWEPSRVTFPGALAAENYFFLGYAVLLCLPWQKTSEDKNWYRWFALVCLFSILFAFAMVSEVMAKNYIAQGSKSPHPSLPSHSAFLLVRSNPARALSSQAGITFLNARARQKSFPHVARLLPRWEP